MQPQIRELFDEVLVYPDPDYKSRFDRLVGIDDHKERLTKVISLLVNKERIFSWAKKHHPQADKSLDAVITRPPLIVLAGDVGSGKSELALTVGDAVARQDKITVTLLPLSLSTRGQGRVGEMTQLISAAFNHTFEEAEKIKDSRKGAVILLIDEADALAQSRENSQMHHEDKAGVNAFIRGIDRIAAAKLPATIIMCTNRLNALDPAVKRRAAEILRFDRPNSEQRSTVLSKPLSELGFSKKDIDEVVELTGPHSERSYGFTYSDIVQRLIPGIVLKYYPDKKVDPKEALTIVKNTIATPPFKDLEV